MVFIILLIKEYQGGSHLKVYDIQSYFDCFFIGVVSPFVNNLTDFLVVTIFIKGQMLTVYTGAIVTPYLFIYNYSSLYFWSYDWTMVTHE